LAGGLCPMHCRIVHMFGNLRESGHGCKWTTCSTVSNFVKLLIVFKNLY
jgi:hypothetical protein